VNQIFLYVLFDRKNITKYFFRPEKKQSEDQSKYSTTIPKKIAVYRLIQRPSYLISENKIASDLLHIVPQHYASFNDWMIYHQMIKLSE